MSSLSSAYLWIGLGSALGGMARHGCTVALAARYGEALPWGTIAVNVLGSFLIGLAASLAGPDGRPLLGAAGRQFFMIGVLGGYTTFSAFSLQTLALLRDGAILRAGANVGLSLALCLAAVWLGHLAALGLDQLRGA